MAMIVQAVDGSQCTFNCWHQSLNINLAVVVVQCVRSADVWNESWSISRRVGNCVVMYPFLIFRLRFCTWVRNCEWLRMIEIFAYGRPGLGLG